MCKHSSCSIFLTLMLHEWYTLPTNILIFSKYVEYMVIVAYVKSLEPAAPPRCSPYFLNHTRPGQTTPALLKPPQPGPNLPSPAQTTQTVTVTLSKPLWPSLEPCPNHPNPAPTLTPALAKPLSPPQPSP